MFERYVAAMNATRDRDALVAAVTPDIVIERHVGATSPDEVAAIAETYVGIDAVATWFARTPPRCVFALLGPPVADGDAWRVGYSISVDDFYNTGLWVARFAPDGRVAHLAHRPNALPP